MSSTRPPQSLRIHPLLSTKLSPPRPPTGLVARAALLARLDEGINRQVTVIAAPAGFGKTTLVASWLAAHHEAVAWVALDEGDNDPVRFWRYVLTATRAVDARLARSALAYLQSPEPPVFETALTAFINETAQLPKRLVLGLEDYHVITSPAVHGSMAFLLNHLPTALHVMLLTRSEPPLPLARLRARGELSEFGVNDLRFSPAESATFLTQALGAPLPPQAVTHLEERTEGWAAGLRLAALALRDKGSGEEIERIVAQFSGEHRSVLAYLTDEVLAAQPDDVQRFLLQTSFLSRLSGPLCDAVTQRGDSARILEHLHQANLFLTPLDDDGRATWYRYHALFAEAMRHAARLQIDDATRQILHARASRWYADQGLLEEAVESALAAGSDSLAASLIGIYVDRHGLYEMHTLRRWIERLPADVVRERPELGLDYARVLLFSSDRFAPATATLVEAALRPAEMAWREAGNGPRLGEVLALRAAMAGFQGDIARSSGLARQALELLPETEIFWRCSAMCQVGWDELLSGSLPTAESLLLEARALGRASQNGHTALAATLLLGEVNWQGGMFDLAWEQFQQVLDEAIGGDEMLDDQSEALLGLGRIAYERDDLAGAEDFATRAYRLSEQRHHDELQAQSAVVLARVWQARGDRQAALDILQPLTARAVRSAIARWLRAWQAELALAAGDTASAQGWRAFVQAQDEVDIRGVQELESLVLARLYLAENRLQGVADALEAWRAQAHKQGRVGSEIQVLCRQALAHQAQAQAAEAAAALSDALHLALHRGYRRVFLDEGPALASLLPKVIPTLHQRSLVAYATALHRQLMPQGRLASLEATPWIEPLSAQETRVLRLLVAGLPNAEIARELVVSINTIKTQVQSIYRKLGVNSRDEARAAAREQRLL